MKRKDHALTFTPSFSSRRRILAAIAFVVTPVAVSLTMPAAGMPPAEWIEPATGHRVIRLSKEPGTASLYFHDNAFTAKGDKMVVTTPEGLGVIDMNTRENSGLVTARARNIIVGGKTRQVFYLGEYNQVFATDLDTRKTRLIVRLPADMRVGYGFSINADEKLLAGSFLKVTAGQGLTQLDPLTQDGRYRTLVERLETLVPMSLFTIDIGTGTLKTVLQDSPNWLGHVQMSPADPARMLFCHEGQWRHVDRLWTIRLDGTGLKLLLRRTMENEIAGHEFFSPDGRIVWYDWQTPAGKEFWLAGHVLSTGGTIKYRLERDHWSMHYNVSPDGKRFCGDGGLPGETRGNEQWIYLYTPRNGQLEVKRLVDLTKHDYRREGSFRLEPNVRFTPDGKWIVFKSNLHGAIHTYAVEVRKTAGRRNP